MISRKTENVAESPFEINLQLFAEDEGDVDDTSAEEFEDAEDIDNEDFETDNSDEEAEEPEVADPAQNEQIQNHETNRAFQQMRKQIQEYENFAHSLGYESFAELQQAQQQQQYVNQGYDPVIAEKLAQIDAVTQQAAQRENNLRIAEEKTSLAGKKFFKELETDIDSMINNDPSLSVQDCFNYLKGQKIDELVAKETAAAKQKTLNNINSKQHLKTEGDGSNGDIGDVDIDSDTLQMYIESGMTKAQALKYHKKLYSK